MNTLEELKYYCEEEKSVGALLLTGEWGCGKTYLINNQLKEILKDTHVLIRISLFGMETVEDVKMEVKRKWVFAHVSLEKNEDKVIKNVEKYIATFKTLLGKTIENLASPIKSIVDGALTLNVYDFINIDSKIGKRKVVLVFDDFERSNISTNDLLGCINDYKENQGISTIIVANEDKIRSDENSIDYLEIKEKIIQRTIRHEPDYSSVVENVIKGMEFRKAEYKEFLVNYVDDITIMFSGMMADGKSIDQLNKKRVNENSSEETNNRIENVLKKRPHNIRSLKCALQDFYRVFELLEEKDIPDKQNWLFSYIAFVFSSRAGLIDKDDRYGFSFANDTLSVLYGDYYFSKSMTMGIIDWIIKGDWNRKRIIKELDFIKKREMAISPGEKARTYYIFDLEEDDVKQGYPIMLSEAYLGKLELNDYVHLLWNIRWARQYKLWLPKIDLERLSEGVRTKINFLLQSQADVDNCHSIIGEENRDVFSKEELAVYEIIEEYRNGDMQILSNNRKQYIALMEKDPIAGFKQIKNTRLNCFDDEMVKVSFDAFISLPNIGKHEFVSHFENVWKSNLNYSGYDIETTNIAMKQFAQLLRDYLKECEEKKLTITAFHTNRLINIIESELITNLEK